MSVLRRAACLTGRKPANKNLSLGRPETASAAIGAEAPGMTVTGMPASWQALTSL